MRDKNTAHTTKKRNILGVTILIFIITLLASCAPVQSIGLESSSNIYETGDALYIGFDNPNSTRIRFLVRYIDNGTIKIDHTLTNRSGLLKIPLNYGNYRAHVIDVDYNNRTMATKEFKIGTILQTGVKSVYVRAFEGNMMPVAVTIIFAVGVSAVSLGRFAGLPIMASTLSIISKYNYFPGWPQYLMLFLAVAVSSRYIYEFVRE